EARMGRHPLALPHPRRGLRPRALRHPGAEERDARIPGVPARARLSLRRRDPQPGVPPLPRLIGVRALFLVALDFVGVADRRGERARRARLRLAEVGEAFRVAAVDAALGDHIVYWDVPGLRVDGVEPRELVGHSD